MKIINGNFDISYDKPMTVSGHASDNEYRYEYDGSVEVNFIAFFTAKEDTFILQIDTLYIDDQLKLEIQDELKRENVPIIVLCIASHSHSLPGIDLEKPRLGAYCKKYRDFLKRTIVKNILINIDSFKSEKVSFSSFKKFSRLSIGRRGCKSKGNFSLLSLRNTVPDFSQLGANIEITCFWDKNRTRIVSIIWSFPAHPVLYPNKQKFSADFPGRVREMLREELKDESLTILYFPGCAGDRRPLIKSQTKSKSFLDLVVGQSFKECDYINYEEYCKSLKSDLIDCINSLRLKKIDHQLKMIDYQESKISLNKIGINNKTNNFLRIESLKLNEKVRFIFLNCEPSYAYHNFFAEDCTVTGYSSGVFGYLPTDIQVNQGGYEVNGFMPFFGTSGSFVKDIKKVLKSEYTINQP